MENETVISPLQEQLAKQRKRRRRTAMIIFGVLTLLIVAMGAVVYWLFGGLPTTLRPNIKRGADAEHFIDLPNKLNVAVLGVDSRPQDGDPGRSDTLFVVTIDNVSHEVSVVSIPRDTRVKIPGHGWDKINHAFMFAGSALTRKTTESFLGIPMDYYAEVNMNSFGRIVDAIGGIEIDVETRMQYEDTWDHFVIDLKPGVQRLDGRTALQYVRYRDEEGDIGRVRRQQKFIRAVLTEINSPAILLKAPGIIREVFASLDTDVPLPVMLALARSLKDGTSAGVTTYMVDGLPYYIDGISYWIPDIMKMRQKIAEMQGVAFSGNVQSIARQMNAEYERYLPANAHLDDGTDYSGGDKQPTKTKEAAKPAQKTDPAFKTANPPTSVTPTAPKPVPGSSTTGGQTKSGASAPTKK